MPDSARRALDGLRKVGARVGTVGAIVAIYFGCLLGFFWLDSSPDTLGTPDLTASNETLVVLELVALHPTENQLDLNVIVLPDDSLIDTEFDTLTTDISVRLYPTTDLVELQYTEGSTHPSLCLLVNHDDGEREFAYTAGAEDALKMAKERGWLVVSMKQDWRIVFAAEE